MCQIVLQSSKNFFAVIGVDIALLLHFPRYNETYQEKSREMWVIKMKMTVAAEGKFLYGRQCSERGASL